MRPWEAASLIFFVFIAIAAAVGRRRFDRVYQLFGGATAGLLLTALIAALPYEPWLHDWVAPPSLLLLAYWTSGLLFIRPREPQERVLLGLDRRLRILETARRLPRGLSFVLELAYLAVYPLIPVALCLHMLLTRDPDPERFWNVILVTDFVCFAGLAWVQTRPPRALEGEEPWTSGPRTFNVGLLGRTSIQVNTFPSGHAAEALAAALLVISAPWPVVLALALAAVGISAGAVFGRYHFAADAVAGWVVAVVVWTALS